MKRLIVALLLAVVLVPVGSPAKQPYPGQGLDLKPLRAGLGLGLPYGGFGANAEARITDHLSFTTGLGSSSGGTGWATGLRLYPFGARWAFRPRLEGYYGVVATLEKTDGSKTTDTGWSYGFGFETAPYGPFTTDISFLLVDYDPPAGYTKKSDADVFISFGFGYNF